MTTNPLRDLRDEAAFLVARINSWMGDHMTVDGGRDWDGHVAPSLARLTHLLDIQDRQADPEFKKFASHYVHRGADSLPCHCWEDKDHQIGAEVKKTAAAPSPQPTDNTALVEAWKAGRDAGGQAAASVITMGWLNAKAVEKVQALQPPAALSRAQQPAPDAVAEAWQPIETAPYDTPVEVLIGQMTFAARLMPEASMDEDENPCDQWQAVNEDEHPADWSGGACWGINEDGYPSRQPDAWRALASQDKEAQG